jgi:hypothetical protein
MSLFNTNKKQKEIKEEQKTTYEVDNVCCDNCCSSIEIEDIPYGTPVSEYIENKNLKCSYCGCKLKLIKEF